MAIEKIQAIRGMSDMLPEDAPLWHFFEKEASSLAKLYGYQHIRTPIVEQTRLFKRGIGEVTDIVEKEMIFLRRFLKRRRAFSASGKHGLCRTCLY